MLGSCFRQILWLSACLQITSLERFTKTEKEFCFPPFWLQQSLSFQLPSASGHCCLFSWHFLSLMTVVGYRGCTSLYSWIQHFTVYLCNRLRRLIRWLHYICIWAVKWRTEQNLSSLEDLNKRSFGCFRSFSSRKGQMLSLFILPTYNLAPVSGSFTKPKPHQCQRSQPRKHWLNT